MGCIPHIVPLLFVVVVLCTKSSNAIQCYECNSYTDKRCLSDENNKLGEDMKAACPERSPEGRPYVLCRKIKQAIDFEVNGMPPETRIIRTCGWDNTTYRNRCYQRSGFGGRQEVCACEKDLCNAGPALAAPVLLPLLVAGLLALLRVDL